MSISHDIKSLALEVGFHAVGITTAELFDESEMILSQHLKDGFLDGIRFDQEKIERLCRPRDAMPTARSIIAVALSYLTDDMAEDGRMARFVRCADYHEVMRARLAVLADLITETLGAGVSFKGMCDTRWFSDRSAAIRSGIGVQGKNGCVFVGKYGSWVVLGALLTDLELEVDSLPQTNICGDCDLCTRACPTGALRASRAVDTRICLSLLTQKRGSIPENLREKMGDRLFGCDLCQSVCPLNSRAVPGNIQEFHGRGIGANPDPCLLVNMSQDDFDATVVPTGAGWIGRASFRRNAAVALGNLGDPSAIPALTEALSDPDPIIQEHASWALGRIGEE
jgi:epoxyqueuosine reductase